MIDAAFYGFVAKDAEPRTSQAGKPWVRLSVGVGKDEAVQWVSVAVFGKAAEKAAQLVKGDRVYIEGTLRLDSWRANNGTERHGLNVASFKCERTHNIGRNRPKRDGQREEPRQDAGSIHGAPFNDEIPFAPEWRA